MQDSHSASRYGVLRGMHYQDMREPLGKLVRCTVGRMLDVAIDLRASSPTFGQWFSIELSAENKRLVYVPVGFAHGFATLSDYCEVQYKQTGYYRPDAEGGIAWNDPDIGIAWPYTIRCSRGGTSSSAAFRTTAGIRRSIEFWRGVSCCRSWP